MKTKHKAERVPIPNPTERVTGLQCENQTFPVGIDLHHHRFSWRIESGRRGCAPIAYRIMVASSGEALQSDAADVWDSGRVDSSETTHVRYGGPPLEGFRRYFWTVMCWDDTETELRPLRPASFATGVLDGWTQDVRWISMTNPTEYTSTSDPFIGKHHTEYFASYFRKEFQCDRPVAAAYAAVSAMGWCELWLNGRKVGNRVLDPAPTEFKNDTLYSCYDIGDQVRESNCVGAILGNGRCLKLYGYEQPAVLVLIHVAFTDGSTMTVSSDSTWTAAHGPIRENGIYFGEHYDGRLEDDRWAVTGGGSDDWKPAKAVAGPMPQWQSMEPIHVDQDLQAQSISSPASGTYIYDFGQNISGFVRMSVRGPRGTTVTIRHAELLGDDGTLNTSTNRFAEATDVYILHGDGEEIFEPRFTYHGFRYAEITGYPGVPSDESLIARFVHSAVEPTGTFSCSSPLINQVHRNVIWGQLSNLVGIPTDCPQREER